MKKVISIAAISLALFALSAHAKPDEPNRHFYQGNAYYEKRDYAKAIESYVRVLDMNLESGSLYYNIGNAFFKLGKLGYAILCYEKASRLIPGDGDLKSNLGYARSLAEDAPLEPRKNRILALMKRPFKDFNLGALAVFTAAFYLLAVLLLATGAINPVFAKKGKLLIFAVLAVFAAALAVFAVRYYDEEMSRHGILIHKSAECKYEPLEKSTTYYTLHEGAKVRILQTGNGWLKVRRADGRSGWLKKESVAGI